ncbi:MAG: hypothetical protein IT182_02240 [Acidobacteria bacterium]|nr:hypothetical protein [Acidobacteriota bacterium]
MRTLAPLPVDSALAPLRVALQSYRAAVLVATPGAGKTTRVPPALVDEGRVLVLQPRRAAERHRYHLCRLMWIHRLRPCRH